MSRAKPARKAGQSFWPENNQYLYHPTAVGGRLILEAGQCILELFDFGRNPQYRVFRMAFPATPLTLIERLADGGSQDDWKAFADDYWGPVCRFALRWGAGNLTNAEEVAAETFKVVWESQLLRRWAANRSARLRSLLCKVSRNILANRSRAAAKQPLPLDQEPFEKEENGPSAMFYAACVEDVVSRAIESLAADYHRQAKGDYFRVLFGRLCQGLTIDQTAKLLNIKPTDVDNYFRHAKKRLEEKFREIVRKRVSDYFGPEQVEEEFAGEWGELGVYLAEQGGLDQAVQRAYELLNPEDARHARQSGISAMANRPRSGE